MAVKLILSARGRPLAKRSIETDGKPMAENTKRCRWIVLFIENIRDLFATIERLRRGRSALVSGAGAGRYFAGAGLHGGVRPAAG